MLDVLVDRVICAYFLFLQLLKLYLEVFNIFSMMSWLKSHYSLYCAYLTAPIFFHASRDGYVMNAYYTTLEMVDAYGTLVLAFLFISAVVYYRNTLFRVFFYSSALSSKTGRKSLWNDSNWVGRNVANRSKNLTTITSGYRTFGLNISPIFKSFKTNFKGRK